MNPTAEMKSIARVAKKCAARRSPPIVVHPSPLPVRRRRVAARDLK
jgi:hypothetical protein